MRRSICLAGLLVMSGHIATVCVGAPPEKKIRPAKASRVLRPGKIEKLPEFTPERESAALTFVGLHHSELAGVLSSLKSSRQSEYEQAIRELFQISERLAELKARDLAGHELAVEAWKLKSRSELLAAKLQHARDPRLEKELREALAQQIEVQKRQYELEIARLKTRVEKLESDVARLNDKPDKLVENRFRQLTRGTKGRGKANPAKATKSTEAEE